MPTAAEIRPAIIDRSLGLELVRVTEAAAIAAGQWVGMGARMPLTAPR